MSALLLIAWSGRAVIMRAAPQEGAALMHATRENVHWRLRRGSLGLSFLPADALVFVVPARARLELVRKESREFLER